MSLYAGAATSDISPQQPVALYGYPHVERISTGIHDPLLATVIVLRNGPDTVVLASLDLLMIEPHVARELRHGVASRVDCPESSVFISCTHTHSGPVTSRLVGWRNDPAVPDPEPWVLERITSQVYKAAIAAVESLAPAQLAWTTADGAGVGGNRLNDGGATDPECGVLAVRNADSGQMLGMALIYGMHPTVLHEDSTLVSADFPHYTRVHIAEHVGRDLPIAYHTAPCGNQSPRRFVNGQTFGEAERLGRKLGGAVCDALDDIREEAWQTSPKLHGQVTCVELPRNTIRPREEAERLLQEYQDRYRQLQRDNAPRADVRTAECAVFGAEGTVALAQAAAEGELDDILRHYQPVAVQVLQVGDAFVAGLQGECFTEYGLDIKRHAPQRTFVVSLVNGDLQGYIVTPEAAERGGYEATNAVFAPDAGSILVDTVLSMIG